MAVLGTPSDSLKKYGTLLMDRLFLFSHSELGVNNQSDFIARENDKSQSNPKQTFYNIVLLIVTRNVVGYTHTQLARH